MNKSRREALMWLIINMEKWVAQGKEIRKQLQDIFYDEQNYYYNIPDNLQNSIRTMESEMAIDTMEDTIESMNEALDAADEAVRRINTV